MTKEEAKKRIEKLKEVINHHRYLYHVLDRQEISDEALDSLKHELYKLEREFPEFLTPDSPTQRVGGKVLEGFKKIRHSEPMLSIEDIFSEEELEKWENYLKKMAPGKIDFFLEPKIDGFAVTLIYDKGILKSAATRGDGLLGEDVTQNIKTVEAIPLKLEIHAEAGLDAKIRDVLEKSVGKGEIEVRGEVYMESRDFEKLNKRLEKKGEKTFANPRNLAAGSIRQLDPKLAASRPLKFFAYDIITDVGQHYHDESHKVLSALGFKTDRGKICKSLEEIMSRWKNIAAKRDSFPFQIDGVVIVVNEIALFKKLGVAGKSPRGIRAFKFSPKEATTVIEDVKFQVGRTGAVTPVAILKPVNIAGVTVSRATLHNEDEIRKLDARINDTVSVIRAGDVIPAVAKVFKELRTGKEKKIKIPEKCPVCGTKLVRPEKEAVWRCPNSGCSARKRKYFYHFVSRGAFNIDGLGPKIIDRLIEEGLIFDPADLFSLTEKDIEPLERFAEKSAENLINSIRSGKIVPFSRFIYALGIRNVGEQTALDLAGRFRSLDSLMSAKQNELETVKDIGPVASKSIYEFFKNKNNLKFIEKLKKAGIIIKKQKTYYKNAKLKGLVFAITGTLKSMSREEAKKKIIDSGGRVSESVSENTDFVVVGKEPGSKLEKAREAGVKLIKEEEFAKMIR